MEVTGSLSIPPAKRNACNGVKKRSKEKVPHDLVIEILSWLHIKHLWPLRCVSKSWLNLITKNPQFAKLQFDRFMEINNNQPDPMILGSLFHDEYAIESDVVVATDFMSCDMAFSVKLPFHHSICGISNGLVCFSSWPHRNEVCIWNPLTTDSITLSCEPALPIRFPGYQTCIGFGFVPDVNVYKVVRFFYESNFDEDVGELHTSGMQVIVCSIGVDSMWRNVEVDIPHYLALSMEICTLVNGALHWRTRRPGSTSWDRIVAFDLKEEVIGEFLLPDGIKFQEIIELSGLLCAINHQRVDEEETHIWVMKEYGVVSSWSKQYIIGKPEGHINCKYLLPFGITHNGGIMLSSAGGRLILYNPETKTFKDLKRFRYASFQMYAFLGSIISPKAIRQAGHTLLEEES